jgi:hypothetical protein
MMLLFICYSVTSFGPVAQGRNDRAALDTDDRRAAKEEAKRGVPFIGETIHHHRAACLSIIR